MKLLDIRALLLVLPAAANVAEAQEEESNKALARRFYEQVWFSDNPGAVDELVAPEYVLHDVGDLKSVTEPAAQQKAIAGFFWQNGTMTGTIDYQVAEGDLVATRWQWVFEPRSWWMKLFMMGGEKSVPVINVFRFQDGKIVEIWNHRHDIDIGFRRNVLLVKGFLTGILVAVLAGIAGRIWRRRRPRVGTDPVPVS